METDRSQTISPALQEVNTMCTALLQRRLRINNATKLKKISMSISLEKLLSLPLLRVHARRG